MHCTEAPCQEVCPTTATYYRPDKIVDIKYELCVGCGYCIVACPYHARTIIFNKKCNYDAEATPQELDKGSPNFDHIGICKKCNFCLPRVDAGLESGLQPGLDPEATPMCVNSCSSEALYFGDLDDPTSKVSRLIRENKTARLQEELGTDPSLYYIVNDNNPEDSGVGEMQLIKPKKLEVWKWPAVVNFVLGGTAAGFYLIYLLIASINSNVLIVSQFDKLKLLAPILMGLGFLALTLEAGRPLRSHYLLRNLNSSWMSRETLACTIFILVMVIEWFYHNHILQSIAVVAAVGLMISQGFIVYRARAVTAWNVPLMPLLFVTSSFTMGAGLILLLAAMGKLTIGSDFIVVGLVFFVLDLLLWILYLSSYNDTIFREATERLRRPINLVLTVGMGHLFPVVLLLLIALRDNMGLKSQHIILLLASLTILVGGLTQKVGIVLRANYLRGIVIGYPKNNA
jgi:phenylacetyl-CoA:acceptor oxidoreductase subunit 1